MLSVPLSGERIGIARRTGSSQRCRRVRPSYADNRGSVRAANPGRFGSCLSSECVPQTTSITVIIIRNGTAQSREARQKEDHANTARLDE